jgi:MFS transporter, ACS family, solute carrier family 17 (sodium-dependent inorganic phosphate cotransporter), other
VTGLVSQVGSSLPQRRMDRRVSLGRRQRHIVDSTTSKRSIVMCSSQTDDSAGDKTTGWKRRWTIVAMCFSAFMLCNMDRVNMSIAILPMAESFSWSSATIGLVQSSFFWGYLLTQILGGVWADRYGGKVVLGFGVIWWSLATFMTPMAAAMGLPALLVARACMGIGEGVAMPAMNNIMSKWIPVKERSRSLSLVYSGMYTGSVIGLGCSPQLINGLGWPSVFYIFGSIGIAWFIWWNTKAASTPYDDPRISKEEETYIVDNTVARCDLQKSIPWKLLLSKKPVWALIGSHFCHNWGTFILLTWMPTYYNQVLGLDLKSSGFFSVLPWITMAVSANIGGWIADGLVAKGWSVTSVRKLMQTLGFLGPAFFLTQLGNVTTVTEAVLCMMAAQGFDAFSQSGLYSNHQDIGPQYSGVLLGMSNTAGVLAGVLGTAATGYILQNGSWDDVWSLAVGLYLLGTFIWNAFSTGERIFD